MESLLRQTRENRDRSDDDTERESYQNLIKIYTNKVESFRRQLDKMDNENTEQRRKDAEISSWRRMGKAMVSKTLDQNPEMFNKIRDAVAAAAETTSNKQAFLAGVGSGLQDLSKPSRKKKKVVEGERHTSPRLTENEAVTSAQDSDADAEDSDGGAMDVSQ